MKLKLTKNQISRLNEDFTKHHKQLLSIAEDKYEKNQILDFEVEIDLVANTMKYSKNKQKSETFDVPWDLADNIAQSDCRDAYKFAVHFQKCCAKA